MNNAHCCCNQVDPPLNCPAPCIMVTLSGVQLLIGDESHPCWVAGGMVGSTMAGVNGTFILPLVSGVPGGLANYAADIPVIISGIQSEGTGSDSTTWASGVMNLSVDDVECVNGLITQYGSVGAVAGTGGEGFTAFNPDGTNNGPVSGVGQIFTVSAAPPLMLGVGYQSHLQPSGDCVNELTYMHGGVAVVSQPESCTLPPVYHYAVQCDDPTDRILVDLGTMPTEGATNCLYLAKLYRVIDEWTTSGSAVTVAWVLDRCPNTPSSLIARRCDDPSATISFDPSTQTVDGVTILFGGDRFAPTAIASNQIPVAVTWSPVPCPPVAGQIARRCDGAPGEITYDPTTQIPGSLTMIYSNVRYFPTSIASNQPAVVVVWSASGCHTGGPRPQNPCNDLACQPNSPNYPGCCGLLPYADCPQCNSALTVGDALGASVVRMGGSGIAKRSTNPLKKRGMVSEAQLDAMGADPEAEGRRARQGGCCDPPRAID